MSWYSEYRNEWKEIIETVARECKRAELMVEKDTVQSMFLLELSKIDLPFVFKGGTSLSKAYNRIDRFSEDIDLSMNRKPTQTERKASKEHIVEIAKSLGMELTNPDQIKSRHDYNTGLDRDKVLNEKGEVIGLSFGRQNACYFRRMISDCCLDTEYTELGTEVYILWGNPGQRQMKIRAKVARYPYNNVLRSSEVDVSKL